MKRVAASTQIKKSSTSKLTIARVCGLGVGIFIGFSLLQLPLYSAPNDIKVIVPHKEIGIEDTLKVTLEFHNSTDSIEALTIESSTFKNLGQVASAHRLRFSNGQVFQQKTYTYALRPLKIGSGSFSIRLGSKPYGTHTLNIVAGSLLKSTQCPVFTPPPEHEQTEEQFIVESTLDQDILFINQPTRYRVYLYNRVNFKPLSINPPSHNGISIIENLHTDEQRQTLVKKGHSYTRRLIRDNIIYPIKTGTHTIANSFIDVIVLNSDFLANNFRKTLSVPPVTLTVRPYPDVDKNKYFRNDYGDFTLSLTQSHYTHTVNSPITLSLRITGTGNLKALLLPDLRTFLTSTSSTSPNSQPFSIRKGPLTEHYVPTSKDFFSGYKESQYYILAETPGTLTLPPLAFTYFSHKAQRYKTLETTLEPLRILAQETPKLALLTTPQTAHPPQTYEDALKIFMLSLFTPPPLQQPLAALQASPLPQNTLEHVPVLKETSSPLQTFFFYHLIAFFFIGSFVLIQYKKNKALKVLPPSPQNLDSHLTQPHATPNHPTSPVFKYTSSLYQSTRKTIVHLKKNILHKTTAPPTLIKQAQASPLAAQEQVSRQNETMLTTLSETLDTYLQASFHSMLSLHLWEQAAQSATQHVAEPSQALLQKLLSADKPTHKLSIRECRTLLTELIFYHAHTKWMSELQPPVTELLKTLEQLEQRLYAPPSPKTSGAHHTPTITHPTKTLIDTTLKVLKSIDTSLRKYSHLTTSKS